MYLWGRDSVGGRKPWNKRDGKRAEMDARGSFLKAECISILSGDFNFSF